MYLSNDILEKHLNFIIFSNFYNAEKLHSSTANSLECVYGTHEIANAPPKEAEAYSGMY